MPWIQVTLGIAPAAPVEAIAERLAAAAASALGLNVADVSVLVVTATGAGAPGALITIAGRRREAGAEAVLADAAVQTVVDSTGLASDFIGVLRL
jgi:hypothetical protein